jgi:hypothetical protein
MNTKIRNQYNKSLMMKTKTTLLEEQRQRWTKWRIAWPSSLRKKYKTSGRYSTSLTKRKMAQLTSKTSTPSWGVCRETHLKLKT